MGHSYFERKCNFMPSHENIMKENWKYHTLFNNLETEEFIFIKL